MMFLCGYAAGAVSAVLVLYLLALWFDRGFRPKRAVDIGPVRAVFEWEQGGKRWAPLFCAVGRACTLSPGVPSLEEVLENLGKECGMVFHAPPPVQPAIFVGKDGKGWGKREQSIRKALSQLNRFERAGERNHTQVGGVRRGRQTSPARHR